MLCCKHANFVFANENYFNENLNVYFAKKNEICLEKKENAGVSKSSQ